MRRGAIRTGTARTGTAGARAGVVTGGGGGGRRAGGAGGGGPFTGHGGVSRTRQGEGDHARRGQPGQADRRGRAPPSRPAALPLGSNRQHVPLALVHQELLLGVRYCIGSNGSSWARRERKRKKQINT